MRFLHLASTAMALAAVNPSRLVLLVRTSDEREASRRRDVEEAVRRWEMVALALPDEEVEAVVGMSEGRGARAVVVAADGRVVAPLPSPSANEFAEEVERVGRRYVEAVAAVVVLGSAAVEPVATQTQAKTYGADQWVASGSPARSRASSVAAAAAAPVRMPELVAEPPPPPVSSTASVSSRAASSSASSVASSTQAPPQEVTLAIRFPDGDRTQLKLSSSSRLKEVLEALGNGFEEAELVGGAPRRRFKPEKDGNATLAELGLAPSAALVVEFPRALRGATGAGGGANPLQQAWAWLVSVLAWLWSLVTGFVQRMRAPRQPQQQRLRLRMPDNQ